jgi:hypothetical protein
MTSAWPGAGSSGSRWQSLPLFDRYEVDLVLSGHEHNYERSYPVRDYDRGAHGTVFAPHPDQTAGERIDTRRAASQIVRGNVRQVLPPSVDRPSPSASSRRTWRTSHGHGQGRRCCRARQTQEAAADDENGGLMAAGCPALLDLFAGAGCSWPTSMRGATSSLPTWTLLGSAVPAHSHYQVRRHGDRTEGQTRLPADGCECVSPSDLARPPPQPRLTPGRGLGQPG